MQTERANSATSSGGPAQGPTCASRFLFSPSQKFTTPSPPGAAPGGGGHMAVREAAANPLRPQAAQAQRRGPAASARAPPVAKVP